MSETRDAEEALREWFGGDLPPVNPEYLQRLREAEQPVPTPGDIERARELARELGLDRKPDGSP